MTASGVQAEQWGEDNEVLAQIGAAFYRLDTRMRVLLASDLADTAVRAWQRHDVVTIGDSVETFAEQIVRQRAGTLALIGAAIEAQSRTSTAGGVDVEIDAWLVGLALDAAGDHGLISGAPAKRSPSVVSFDGVILEVRSEPSRLYDLFVAALSNEGIVENLIQDNGEFVLRFAPGGQHLSHESTLAAILDVVRQLDNGARAGFDCAAIRRIRVEVGKAGQPNLDCDAETIAALAAFDIGLTFKTLQ